MKFLITIILINSFFTFGQFNFKRHPANPVLFDSTRKQMYSHLPSVIYNQDSSRFEMYYTVNYIEHYPTAIHLAFSKDGINWTKHPTPVLGISLGSWESEPHRGSVIRENGFYKMWYWGYNRIKQNYSVGYASSADGINWQKLSTPVFEPSGNGWDSKEIRHVTVGYSGGKYVMFYSGCAEYNIYTNPPRYQIGRAVSSDGINWQRDDEPIIPFGSSDWDSMSVFNPRKLLLDNIQFIWYNAYTTSYDFVKKGLAYSTDNGITWNKYLANPLDLEISSGGLYDEMIGEVILSPDSILKTWFNENDNQQISFATSTFNPVFPSYIKTFPDRVLKPGNPIIVNASFINPDNYGVDYKIIIEDRQGDTAVFIKMYDDGFHNDSLAGDGIWGNITSPVEEEEFYKTGLVVENKNLKQVTYYKDLSRFTTAGPVVIEKIKVFFSPPPYINPDVWVTPSIKNLSSKAVITDVMLKIRCNDPWGGGTATWEMPDILPGGIVSPPWPLNFVFNDSLYPGYFNFTVEIFVDGLLYWTDSLKKITGIENTEQFSFQLYQNYPNPFNPETKINYSLARQSHVTIKIFDILGKETAELVNEEKLSGNYQVTWNAAAFPSGVYFIKMKAGDFTSTKKIILIK